MPKGISSIVRTCLYCGAAFTATNGAAFYCSRECGFWIKVSNEPTETGCLLWLGGVDKNGYGLYWSGKAHRIAWEYTFGAIDSRLHVLHACDTPACCNPNHLMAGTNTANRIDCERKLRHGERNGRAKLTEQDIRDIREAKAAGQSGNVLALKYGVNRSSINRAARRESWSRV